MIQTEVIRYKEARIRRGLEIQGLHGLKHIRNDSQFGHIGFVLSHKSILLFDPRVVSWT